MFAVGNVRVVEKGGGGEAGLELVVRSEMVDGMVSVAELDTERLDLRWGTFRAVMKVSGVRGTCAAFFWVSCEHTVLLFFFCGLGILILVLSLSL
jgi:hypothetical protein